MGANPALSAGSLPHSLAYSQTFGLGIIFNALPLDRIMLQAGISAALNNSEAENPAGLGFTFNFENVSDVSLFDDFGMPAGSESVYNLSAGAGFGVKIKKLFSFGLGAKYLYYNLASYNQAHGFSLDVSFVYHSFLPKLSFYLVMNDIYSLRWWATGTSDMLPAALTLGALYSLLDDKLAFSAGLINRGVWSDIAHFTGYNVFITLQAALTPDLTARGHFSFGEEIKFSAGAAYRIPKIGDIAYSLLYEKPGVGHSAEFAVSAGQAKNTPYYKTPAYSAAKKEDQKKNLYVEAMNFFMKRDYKKAKDKFEQLIKLDPENVSAKSMLKKIDDILLFEGE